MDKLVADTCRKAERWLNEFSAPCVLWSGGKDSNAMLHILLHKVGVKLPCVQYRDPWFRDRYELADALTRAWDLDVHDYPPSRVALTDGTSPDGKHQIDFLKYQQWGQQTALIISIGSQPPVDGKPWRCGLDALQRPLGAFAWPWDACFHGQKSADVDPIKGLLPLSVDAQRIADAPTQLYLMRDWSDEDVWRYLEAEGIPNDETRYGRDDTGSWSHLADKSRNADYPHVCTRCISRAETDTVWCPKLNAQVNNISAHLPYEDHANSAQGFEHRSQNVSGRPITRIIDGRVAA
jgi:hypothetical protein